MSSATRALCALGKGRHDQSEGGLVKPLIHRLYVEYRGWSLGACSSNVDVTDVAQRLHAVTDPLVATHEWFEIQSLAFRGSRLIVCGMRDQLWRMSQAHFCCA